MRASLSVFMVLPVRQWCLLGAPVVEESILAIPEGADYPDYLLIQRSRRRLEVGNARQFANDSGSLGFESLCQKRKRCAQTRF